MLINLSDKIVKKILFSYLPNDDPFSTNNNREFRQYIAKEIMKKMGEIKLPVISKEELKSAVLEKMAQRAIEKMEE